MANEVGTAADSTAKNPNGHSSLAAPGGELEVADLRSDGGAAGIGADEQLSPEANGAGASPQDEAAGAASGGGNGGGGPPNDADGNGAADSMPAFLVSHVREGQNDSRGVGITRVYFKRREYAVYDSSSRIFIQYADAEARASEQIKRVATLIPLRDRLNYLLVGARLPDCYREQIAESLRLGLEGEPEVAKTTLEAAISDAVARLERVGRLAYVKYAGAVAAALATTVTLIALGVQSSAAALSLLLLATAAGAVGALFSLAIGIRARRVVVDSDWTTNAVDGAIRVGIGAISGAVLFLILNSGLMNNIEAGDIKFVGEGASWQPAMLIGFAAGFLERLVPDLLEKKTGSKASPDAAPVPQ